MVASVAKRRGELTLSEAALLLNRPKITLYKWVKRYDLPWRYVCEDGTRHVAVRREDLVRLNEERARRSSPVRRSPAARRGQAARADTLALRVAHGEMSALFWTWKFKVVNGTPAQAVEAYRREYHQMIRQWKKGA